MSEPSVRVSGTVLASLMFQLVNSDSDVEGSVSGESSFHEQVTISDSQSDHIHIEEIYNIQKHIACSKSNTSYSSSGEVNLDVSQQILADNQQDSVIGWFRQRRHSEQHMTFREKSVHEESKNASKNPHMIFSSSTSSTVTPSDSTHRMEYSAFTSRSRRFVNIPVSVTNSGSSEQQSYWKVSAPCSASGYSLIMNKHRSRFFSSSGSSKEVDEMNKMNDSSQAESQKVCRDVEQSERAVEASQMEVSASRRSLREKQQQSSAGKAAGTTQSDPPPTRPQRRAHSVVSIGTTNPAEPRNNQSSSEAVRASLGSSPLFLAQTVNSQAFPVPSRDAITEKSGSEQQEGCGRRGRKRRRNNC